jgi:putative transposase
MPRVARLVLPGIPHHVTQRGNRGQRTFFGPDDYRFYQQLLRRWTGEARTSVWAWCLMPNHVHIIVVPEDETGLRRLFGPVHRQYTWRVNQREDWRGCLWQSRYGSVAMDEAHLHVCLRYVELNPVRAGLVDRPEAWPWSSARAHLGLAGDGITDLAAMRRRIDDWSEFLDFGLADADRDAIRAAERSGRPLGRPTPRVDRS